MTDSGCRPATASVIAWFKKASTEPTAHVLVAEEAGDAVGYLYADEVRREKTWVRPAMRFFMLHHIAVAPAFQKRGVGGELMQAFIAEARRRRISRVELDVWSFNGTAQRFFARHGFSVFNCRMEALLRNLPKTPLLTPGKRPPSNNDQGPELRTSKVWAKYTMHARDPDPRKEVSRPGDSTKRIVVFLFGALFAIVGIGAAVAKRYGIAAVLGAPALLLASIALWGSRRAVTTTHKYTDISTPP